MGVRQDLVFLIQDIQDKEGLRTFIWDSGYGRWSEKDDKYIQNVYDAIEAEFILKEDVGMDMDEWTDFFEGDK